MRFSLLALAALPAAVFGAELGVEKLVRKTCSRPTRESDTVEMHYTGTLASDGSKFDSSLDRGQPFMFTLGIGQVIKGWDQGLQGMCIGEKWKLTIPHELAYGERGFPPVIPEKATLVFEVELVGIKGVKSDSVDFVEEGEKKEEEEEVKEVKEEEKVEEKKEAKDEL